MFAPRFISAVSGVLIAFLGPAPQIGAQGPSSDLDSLIRLGLATSPNLQAAVNQMRAAQARIGPAGAWPDPILGAGITDLPIARPGFYDPFTMKAVRVTQTVPLAGAPAARARAAKHEATAAGEQVQSSRLEMVQQIKEAYYDLVFVDRALANLERSHDVLVELQKAAEARYSNGNGTQQEIIDAGIEVARRVEEAVALRAQRASALARLNATLNRPTETPVDRPQIPAALLRAAVPDSVAPLSFVSADFGATAAHSPLPPVAALQDEAVGKSPVLRADQAMIDADASRLDVARKSRIPDLDVSVEYDERDGLPDYVTAMVSVPVPIHSGRKQAQGVNEARSQLTADQAERVVRENTLRAAIADSYADVERARTQVALYARNLLPQAQARVHSTMVGYQAGHGEFASVLAAQAAVSEYETNYDRALTDFAKGVAKLDAMVGTEVLP